MKRARWLFLITALLFACSNNKEGGSVSPASLIGMWMRSGSTPSNWKVIFFAIEHGTPKWGFYYPSEKCGSLNKYTLAPDNQFRGSLNVAGEVQFSLVTETSERIRFESARLVDQGTSVNIDYLFNGQWERIPNETIPTKIAELGICQNYARNN